MSLIIEGGSVPSGSVRVSGAKNAALPLIAAAALVDETTLIRNVPVLLSDVGAMLRLLPAVGCTVCQRDAHVAVRAGSGPPLPLDRRLCAQTRYSILFLAVCLRRFGRVTLPLPGGCRIGESRPVDIHLEGLAAFGAEIALEGDCIHATMASPRSRRYRLRFPSVGATLQLMLACVTGPGTYVLEGIAREPEIVAVGSFLSACGARIVGLGTSRIEIEGVSSLSAREWVVMSDRLEAATFAVIAALLRGDVRIGPVETLHVAAVRRVLADLGVPDEWDATTRTWTVRGSLSSPRLRPLEVVAEPFPGLPTDVQPLLATLLLRADGRSTIRDRVFPRRFAYVTELTRLGARMAIRGDNEVTTEFSVDVLRPSVMRCPDIRGGIACLLGALLCGRGQTILECEEQLCRGYQDLEAKLRGIGVVVRAVPSHAVDGSHNFV